MLHIFLFDVIKVYLKIKIAFVGFLFLVLRNCNCFENSNGELHFRPLPFTILGTICLKKQKSHRSKFSKTTKTNTGKENFHVKISAKKPLVLQVFFPVTQIGYC